MPCVPYALTWRVWGLDDLFPEAVGRVFEKET